MIVSWIIFIINLIKGYLLFIKIIIVIVLTNELTINIILIKLLFNYNELFK